MMPQVYSYKAKHQAIDPIPEGAIYVGRAMPRLRLKGSLYGNPYRLSKDTPEGRRVVLIAYCALLADELQENPRFLDELRGKDLICFCHAPHTPYKPCHADVLLLAAQDPAGWLARFNQARNGDEILGLQAGPVLQETLPGTYDRPAR